MKKKEYEEMLPFLETLTMEQAKVIWYIEARKRGNPCITDQEKTDALNTSLIDIPKIKLRNPIKINDQLYTDTGNKWN